MRPTFAGYFQHVLWQLDRWIDHQPHDLRHRQPTTDPMTLMGVHSSAAGVGYPSTVVIHNTGTTSGEHLARHL